MSAIHLDNRLVHYEVVGRRGQPIIFLHSWLGSWRYWLPTMDHISERYRAYAIDFWGFGESDRHESAFSISEYVDMLCRFIDNMGMNKVILVGHGLGGMVATRAASEQPERFQKLMTVTTPIQGAQIQPILRPGAFSRLLGRSTPANIWSKQVRSMHLDDQQIQREIIEDTDSLSETLVQSVINSVIETDLTPDLARLEVPLLALYGEKDPIITPEDGSRFGEDTKTFKQALKLPKSAHFPFLDQPSVFNRALTDFLASSGSVVEIKAEWRRRVSQLEYI